MTVHEGQPKEHAIYYITDWSPRQMLKSISTYQKALAAGNGDSFKAAYKLMQRIGEVEEFDGPRGTILSLPIANESSERRVLRFEVRRDVTIIYGGDEQNSEVAHRTANRLDELACRFKK